MTIHSSIRTLVRTSFEKTHPIVLTVSPESHQPQLLGMTYSEACLLRDSLTRTLAVYTDVRRRELSRLDAAAPAPVPNLEITI